MKVLFISSFPINSFFFSFESESEKMILRDFAWVSSLKILNGHPKLTWPDKKELDNYHHPFLLRRQNIAQIRKREKLEEKEILILWRHIAPFKLTYFPSDLLDLKRREKYSNKKKSNFTKHFNEEDSIMNLQAENLSSCSPTAASSCNNVSYC